MATFDLLGFITALTRWNQPFVRQLPDAAFQDAWGPGTGMVGDAAYLNDRVLSDARLDRSLMQARGEAWPGAAVGLDDRAIEMLDRQPLPMAPRVQGGRARAGAGVTLLPQSVWDKKDSYLVRVLSHEAGHALQREVLHPRVAGVPMTLADPQPILKDPEKLSNVIEDMVKELETGKTKKTFSSGVPRGIKLLSGAVQRATGFKALFPLLAIGVLGSLLAGVLNGDSSGGTPDGV